MDMTSAVRESGPNKRTGWERGHRLAGETGGRPSSGGWRCPIAEDRGWRQMEFFGRRRAVRGALVLDLPDVVSRAAVGAEEDRA